MRDWDRTLGNIRVVERGRLRILTRVT
jgi:hypothetical protein